MLPKMKNIFVKNIQNDQKTFAIKFMFNLFYNSTFVDKILQYVIIFTPVAV